MRFAGFALIAASLAASLSACSPQAETQAATATAPAGNAAKTHPVSGLSLIDVTVTSGPKVHHFTAELADTPQAQARGLMFRTELGPDEAMIFPSNPPAPRSFWMKNTPLPLDIVFIGVDGRINNIAAMTTPYSLDPVVSEGSTSGVLELAGGRAAQLGISAGDKVEW